ncbi:MAG: ABC transporter substrate-binding protein [Desulfobacteraceae bacterium]|nr:ABC transporter substrate-binding protein [Desulfobacteraceae bacterium]
MDTGLSPGYYSDGIYAGAPFFAYMADREPDSSFRKDFLKKYKKEPFWLAACYYDAMLVALKAVERAEVQGEDIRKDRKKVRDALTKLNSYDASVKGVTGDIYFDAGGNATRALAMGFWYKHKLLPAYLQYRVTRLLTDVPGEQPTEDIELSEGEIRVNELIMAETRVVYTGIDINEIRNLNTDKGTYTADFYLWFRFRGEFDDTGIMFVNAVNPVRLGQPFTESATGDIITRSYRIIADFKIVNGTYGMFPFDHQTLGISFRHTDSTRDELIYIPPAR